MRACVSVCSVCVCVHLCAWAEGGVNQGRRPGCFVWTSGGSPGCEDQQAHGFHWHVAPLEKSKYVSIL